MDVLCSCWYCCLGVIKPCMGVCWNASLTLSRIMALLDEMQGVGVGPPSQGVHSKHMLQGTPKIERDPRSETIRRDQRVTSEHHHRDQARETIYRALITH